MPRTLSICSFGTKYERRCEELGLFRQLKTDVQAEDGGPYSQPDREKEWGTTRTTKCILDDIIDGKEISNDSLETCKSNSALEFEKEVGTIDLKEDDLSGQEEIYSCEEQTMSFHDGTEWVVPPQSPPDADSSLPSSSEYLLQPFTPE